MNKVFYFPDATMSGTVLSTMTHFVRHLSPDKEWKVVISENKPDRSAAQNRLYWVYVTIIGQTLGYSKEEMHEAFKLRHLVPIMLRDDEHFNALWERVMQAADDGVIKSFVALLSTRNLSLTQFAEYLRDIELFAISMSVTLPAKDDDWYEAMGRRAK